MNAPASPRSLWPLSPIGVILRVVAGTATVLALTGSGCAEDKGRVEELVQRTVGDLVAFDQIELRGPINADVTVGPGPSVDIEAPKPLNDRLSVELRDGKLTLEVEGDHDDDDGWVEAKIETPSLKQLALHGAGKITVTDAEGPELQVSARGASQVKLAGVAVDRFTLDVSGAADVQAEGTAKSADYDLSGAGVIKAQNLVAETVELDLSGAGSVRVHATQRVAGDLSGMGKVAIRGNPPEREIDKSGMGAVLFEEPDEAQP